MARLAVVDAWMSQFHVQQRTLTFRRGALSGQKSTIQPLRQLAVLQKICNLQFSGPKSIYLKNPEQHFPNERFEEKITNSSLVSVTK